MSFVVKTANALRNNWKKSIFGACLLTYGVKYTRDRQEEELIRRAFCAKAQEYGSANLGVNEKPRRVTVFLNPAAKAGKGSKLFTKNAAPILYLAGMEVNIVKTEYEGQVKEFVKLLETQDTDAIVVAGGDGTLLEAVTGFMRKEDKNFKKNIPVGVIPLGKTNRFAQFLFGSDLQQVRLIAEAAMAVVRGNTDKVDVVKIEGEEGKTTYAVSGLEAGAFKDAASRKIKYWYFGPLKTYWTYIRTTLRKDWGTTLKGKLLYVESTEENTRMKPAAREMPTPTSRGWLSFLYRPQPPGPSDELVMDDTTDSQQEIDLNTVELSVTSGNLATANKELAGLDVTMGPAEISRRTFIKEGWRREKGDRDQEGPSASYTSSHMRVKSLQLQPELQEGEQMWFKIDGESFEVMPITISLLRKQLSMFCGRSSVSV